MSTQINFHVTGFKKKKIEREKFGARASTILRAFNGCKLDEINLHAKITSVKDIDQLIKFLENSKPCFVSPGK